MVCFDTEQEVSFVPNWLVKEVMMHQRRKRVLNQTIKKKFVTELEFKTNI